MTSIRALFPYLLIHIYYASSKEVLNARSIVLKSFVSFLLVSELCVVYCVYAHIIGLNGIHNSMEILKCELISRSSHSFNGVH